MGRLERVLHGRRARRRAFLLAESTPGASHGIRGRGILGADVTRPREVLAMALPKPVDALWNQLQAVRAEVLAEVEPLSQRQADWKPAEKDWSVGEIVD